MQAQVMLDQAQINPGYTEIKSPIDGRIGLAHFTVGNLVDPASGNAEETKLDVERVIAAFLHSARLGIFDPSLNVLCPGLSGVLDA
jgi:multidrug efflux pump subunit AcrA (membrane-fusion protein)